MTGLGAERVSRVDSLVEMEYVEVIRVLNFSD